MLLDLQHNMIVCMLLVLGNFIFLVKFYFCMLHNVFFFFFLTIEVLIHIF